MPLFEGRGLGYFNTSGRLSSLNRKRFYVSDGERSYEVFCFGDPAQAAHFRGAIKGEDFDPHDRVGHKWIRGRGRKRDSSPARKGHW